MCSALSIYCAGQYRASEEDHLCDAPRTPGHLPPATCAYEQEQRCSKQQQQQHPGAEPQDEQSRLQPNSGAETAAARWREAGGPSCQHTEPTVLVLQEQWTAGRTEESQPPAQAADAGVRYYY